MPLTRRQETPDSSSELSSPDTVEKHLRSIHERYKALLEENARLRGQVASLEAEAQVLRTEASRFKRKYQKIRKAELARETNELNGGTSASAWEDRYLTMKKMEEVVVEDPGEDGKYPDCSICYEELTLDTAAAFPCEHTYHLDCIRALDTNLRAQGGVNKPLSCPSCRRECHLRDVMKVTKSARDQWEELITIATEWATLDTEMDEAETEVSDKISEQASFIEDDIGTAEEDEEGVAEGLSKDERKSDDEAEMLKSPLRAAKRRRLEELAASRSAKKQRML
ncbi:SubName: Full=Uncharacterized protein {ECO:0000313/EMBL:CCA70683.1} [Serendipita indica DSM 11827]|nr:SubName: Full=Uncharacterized protein {ECO:0000313/EMBL:CCA70683.1} [Serendipita indica DSM 11827]